MLHSGTITRYYYRLIVNGVKIILNNGWPSFWSKFWHWYSTRPIKPPDEIITASAYKLWYVQNEPKAEYLQTQKQESFSFQYQPKISIVTPVCNPEPRLLEAAIQSVINQTYDNWELCLADGNSTKPEIKYILEEYAKKDSRILLKFLPVNNGVSENSNEALSLADGEFVGFLDHEDELAPFALYEIIRLLNEKPNIDFIYSDEDKVTLKGKRFAPYFKPDWSPDMILSTMYTGRLSIYRRQIVSEIGNFRQIYDGAQDWDLVLRFMEKTSKIEHISKVLYHRRYYSKSKASKLNNKVNELAAGRKALTDYLVRNNIHGVVDHGPLSGTYRVKREVAGNPLVSIIIPTRDNVHVLEACISSILENTDYANYEVLIVDNQSIEQKTFDYYNQYKNHSKIRILNYDNPFNFSAINNYAVSQSQGDHILLLNNDTEVISNEWLSAMLEHSQREEVGVVGAKLLFSDRSIQHCGVILGSGGSAGNVVARHICHRCPDQPGYFGRINIISNFSAVTGACVMLRKRVYEEVCGLDENLSHSYQDIDLCLKLREKGYLVLYTPYSVLYHKECYTRGYDDTPEKKEHFQKEAEYMRTRWQHIIDKGDPYFNPNLSLHTVGFVKA
jgi:glycosyltransferase involved in cell wall biosynthesis